RRRHTRSTRDWSSDVCSSDLETAGHIPPADGTGFFLFLLQNAMIGSDAAAPGESELYVYWPRQRSEWGDHWRSDGTVVPYSNTRSEERRVGTECRWRRWTHR